LGFIHNGSYFVLKNIDLKGINELTYKFSSRDKAATVEVHTGSPTGPMISTLSYSPTGAWDKYAEQTVGIQSPTGKQDLYFVFTKKDTPNKDLCSLEWIEFK
jgi:cytochrome c